VSIQTIQKSHVPPPACHDETNPDIKLNDLIEAYQLTIYK